MMMMNCFCGMVDQQKTFSLMSSWDHYQRSSPLQIFDTLRFESAQNLRSGLVEWSCAVVITTTLQRQFRFNSWYNQLTLTEPVLVSFLLLTLDKFLFPEVISKINYFNIQEFLRKNIAQSLRGKTVVCLFVVKSWIIAKRESSKRCCSLKAAVPRCLWKGLLKNLLKFMGKHRCFPVTST